MIVLSAEDDPGTTLVPRLRVAGADLSRVFIMGFSFQRDGETEVLTFPADLPLLEEAIATHKAVLVIIDPFTAVLSDRIDSHRDGSIRRPLAQLALIAQRTNCAILLIRHLNKQSTETKALYRGGGSIAITAAARAVYLIGNDPTDDASLPFSERRRVIATAKMNLGPWPPSWAFRLVAEKGEDVAHVEFCSEPCGVTSNELVGGGRSSRKVGAIDEAVDFLRTELDEGPRKQEEIDRRAKELRISNATLRRARKQIGVRSFKRGFAGNWMWALSDEESEEQSEGESAHTGPPSAAGIIAECRMLGITLKVDGSDLLIEPEDVPDRVMREIAARKQEIFAMLKEGNV